MLSCNKVHEMMTLYIDGLMDEEDEAEFKKHLKMCTDCSKELDKITRLVELLGDIPDIELPADFTDELHNKLVHIKVKKKADGKWSFLGKPYFKALSTAAAGLLIILAARGIHNTNNLFLSKSDMITRQTSDRADAVEFSIRGDEENMEMQAQLSSKENSGDISDCARDEAIGQNKMNGIIADDRKTPSEGSRTQSTGVREAPIAIKHASPLKRNIEVSIGTSNPSEKADKILECAREYSAEILEYPVSSDSLDETGNIKIVIEIKNSGHEEFLENLKKTFDADSITVSDADLLDQTDTILQLETELKEINKKIVNLKDGNDDSNPEELDKLKMDQEALLNKIESVKVDSQVTCITVTITKE